LKFCASHAWWIDDVLKPMLKRGGWTLLFTITVAGSLLVFPSALPWMVGGWLVLHTLLVARGAPAWVPLVICGAVVVVKQPGWPESLIVFLAVTVAFAIVHFAAIRMERHPRRLLRWSGVAALWVCWIWFAVDWYEAARSSHAPRLFPSRPVVCIGDSITAYGYPPLLAKKITVPVVDLGVDGITTADALALLGDMKAANPQVVVVELGGHDYLKGRSKTDTSANLVTIIDACHSAGATVVLVEIPRGFVTDGFSGLDRELARRYDLELIPDTAIRNLVLWSEFSPPGMWFDSSSHLSDDGLHPNQRGNEYLAECVADALIRICGPDIVGKDVRVDVNQNGE